MVNKNSKIFLAGHNGMVGSAILDELKIRKFKKIITLEKNKVDLRNQQELFKFLKKKKPEAVKKLPSGYYGVDYSQLDVEFREVA